MQLNHLHLHVADVNRASAFYQNYFGFREAVWHGTILFMRDEAGLDLALAPSNEIGPLPPWFHFGFRLSSADEVRALHKRLPPENVAALVEEPDMISFRCRDPDGYQIEIYWE